MRCRDFLLVSSLLITAPPDDEPPPRVLVFSKTAAYRHDAIAAGVVAVRELGAEGGFAVDATEDAAAFTPENLARYRAVVFLNSSGEVFDDEQKRRSRASSAAAAGWLRFIRGSRRSTSGRGTSPWSAA